MRFDGGVDLIAVKGDDDRGVSGGRGKRGAIDSEIALIDGLVQRNAGEGNKLRVEGCVHEHRRARIDCEKRLQGWGNGIVVGLASVGVLRAFDVDDGMGAQEREDVEDSESDEKREGDSWEGGLKAWEIDAAQ